MTKPLHFAAFVMNTNSHIQHGLWRHPDARQVDFEDITLWIDLAKTLERGKFDALFFADVVGLYGGIDAPYEINAREGLQIPNNDPAALLSALAVSTTHLGFAVTSSILQEHPFSFARKMSTLDHVSGGRIGWNVVTSALENSARNFGFDGLVAHDERYRWAREYLDVVYKLWEGSWDEGALPKNKATGIYADHRKIHKIHHRGERYQVEGPHLSSPSPQRTPLLFQAGASGAGKAFAAEHAEAQFILAPNLEAAAKTTAETRALAVQAGRAEHDIQFYQGLSFIIGDTEEAARKLEAEYVDYLAPEAFLVHSNLGTDPVTGRPVDPDTPLREIKTEGGQGHLAWLRQLSPDREPTVRDLAALSAKLRKRVVGTPEQIADELAGWQGAGIDGILVMNWILPQSYETFVDHVMPVLQERGLAQRDYSEGTLRKKLFGRDRLPDRHHAASYRGAFTPGESA